MTRIIRIGLIWGQIWYAVWVAVGTVIALVDPDSIDPGESPLVVGGIFGLMGLLSGLTFGLLLALGDRGRTISDLSLSRATMWSSRQTSA